MKTTEDGHYIDDPMDVVNAKPNFEGMGITTEEKIEQLSAELEQTKRSLRNLKMIVDEIISIELRS